MPRETEKLSLMIVSGKQIDGQRPGGRNQDGSGTTKSADFFVSGFRTHVVATILCATVCVHTLRVARAFFWHIILAWRTDIAYTRGSRCLQCSCHMSPSHLLLSHDSSAVRAVPARSLRHVVPVCTFLAELFPIRKRGSSAPPHVRRGVWLFGRSHALHMLWNGFFWIPKYRSGTSTLKSQTYWHKVPLRRKDS